MRTELTRVQIGALETSLKENGFDWYEYIAGQAGQCDVCAAMDGKHFEVRKMVIGENAPPMHPNCRCSVAPWEAGAEPGIDVLSAEDTAKEAVLRNAFGDEITIDEKALKRYSKEQIDLLKSL